MNIIFYDKLASKGFWGIQDSDNAGTNIGWIKKKPAPKKGSVFLVNFKYQYSPQRFKNLADAKAFAINQLNGGN
jgi:hypothetical protein